MKLSIAGGGEDPTDKIVPYTLTAETETHKTTLMFYGYADIFMNFAAQLQDFPFKSKEAVVFQWGSRNEAYELTLKLTLADSIGRIIFRVETAHYQYNESAMFEDSVEAMPLEFLANKLREADFTKECELTWDSESAR